MTAPDHPGTVRGRHRPEGAPVTAVVRSWSSALGRAVAVAVLVGLCGLVLLCLVPQAAGLQGHVVVSGSMEPQVAVGDVVLTGPVQAGELAPGQVLLFRDPARPDRLLLHRLVSFDDHGDLVTRGDANQSNDSTHVPVADVLGLAELRVPWVGLPTVWRMQGDWGAIALTAGLLVGATVWATRRSRPDGTSVVAPRHGGRVARAARPAPAAAA